MADIVTKICTCRLYCFLQRFLLQRTWGNFGVHTTHRWLQRYAVVAGADSPQPLLLTFTV